MPGPIGGLDEAGRGPLAGPVVAAVVIAPAGFRLTGLNDSKKLTEKRREALAEEIRAAPELRWALGWASAAEIDSVNILQATFLAMRRALEALPTQPASIVVDGNRKLPGWSGPQEAVIEGDGAVVSIAAASILAKTVRDAQLLALDEQYPQYGFAIHKGYPVPAHLSALAKWGPCPEHRRSFAPVRRLVQEIRLDLGAS
ncbi:MAG: ribonuclease HII [Fibrobacteres bacterium]|nr:ribonuclease HII [Fibrobacterota bacterium]